MSESHDDRMYFYERFADDFDSHVNMYDTRMRVRVVYEELLRDTCLGGKSLLDAGCGTGWFSAEGTRRGASVTSMDLGEGLLAQVGKKCESRRVVGSILEMPFPAETFDLVVSSEVIEHTPDPPKAIAECFRVLRPGGTLVLTTPNAFWYWSCALANALRIRPYDGYENWTSWWKMRRLLASTGFTIQEMKGVHLFPFVVPALNPVLDSFHRFSGALGPIMVNIAVRAVRPE